MSLGFSTSLKVMGFLLGLLVAPGLIYGAGDAPKKNSIEDLIRSEGTKHVQMKSFMAPAYIVGKRGTHQRPLTVVMEVPDYNKVHGLCRQSARIQAKLIEVLFSYPIPTIKGREIDMDLAEKELIPRLVWSVNRAVRDKKAISNIFLIDGTKSLGGGMKSRLPFSSVLGCKELREEPKKEEE